MTITVAPREVVDQVHRASRSHGCDADLADRLAAEIAFCEVHHGGGLAAWVTLADADLLEEAARASFHLAAAEVVAHSSGRTTVGFDPPPPLAAIARSLRDLERRGVRYTPPVGTIADLAGTDLVPSLDLVVDGPAPVPHDRTEDELTTAYHDGLPVDRSLWERLDTAAAGFLVSEAALDAALKPAP